MFFDSLVLLCPKVWRFLKIYVSVEKFVTLLLLLLEMKNICVCVHCMYDLIFWDISRILPDHSCRNYADICLHFPTELAYLDKSFIPHKACKSCISKLPVGKPLKCQ